MRKIEIVTFYVHVSVLGRKLTVVLVWRVFLLLFLSLSFALPPLHRYLKLLSIGQTNARLYFRMKLN